MTLYERFVKRSIDVCVAALALAVLSPLMALVALLILLEDGAPVVFRQVRVGQHGKPFTIFKFRSMPVSAPNVPSAAARTLRTTRVGAFIRRTNIDELPQLMNILRGEMSLIGPRPALPVQTELLAMRKARGVDRLRPGLTGLAQVSAYDGMPEGEKVEWEARYARSLTSWQDVGLVLRTVAYLFRRPPVY